MRQQPEQCPDLVWEGFQLLADEEGYGEHPDDWYPWFHAYAKGCELGARLVSEVLEKSLNTDTEGS